MEYYAAVCEDQPLKDAEVGILVISSRKRLCMANKQGQEGPCVFKVISMTKNSPP